MKMNSKTNNEMSLSFKEPKTLYKESNSNTSPLPPKQYAELVELGLKLLPDIKKEREKRIKNAPTVRFSLFQE